MINYYYFAGIVDAEGSFGIKKSKGKASPAYSIRFKIEMNESEILYLFSNEFGGNVRVTGRKTHTYEISGKLLLSFLDKMLDYIILKKDEAKVLLDFIELQKKHSLLPRKRVKPQDQIDDMEQLYLQCRKMKKEEREILLPATDKDFTAYLAGLWDGDGSISPRVRSKKSKSGIQYYESRISLEMATKNLITAVGNRLNRNIWIREYDNPNHRTNYSISLTTNHYILPSLCENLILKKNLLNQIITKNYK